MQYRDPHNIPLQIHQHVMPTSKSQQQPPTTKALRFVTNSGAPHPKRRRIGAACLTCRRRKTACTGERPFCGTCIKNKFECAGYSSEVQATSPRQTTPDEIIRKGSDQAEEASRKRNRLSSPQAAPSRNVCREPPDSGLGNLSPHATSQARSKDQELATNPVSVIQPRPRIGYDTCNQPSQIKVEPSGQSSLFSGPTKRMPYFRWLGPTAIMPGFKQMVVKVKHSENPDRARSSTNGDSMRSPSLYNNSHTAEIRGPSSTAVDSDLRSTLNLPFYDTSAMPPSELITHLVDTFFVHLGCNYPFLQKERFTRDLEEKKVDAILVDAVCALAARFSTHKLLTQFSNDGEVKASPAEYGHAFAQRAKLALMDTFPCPSVAAAQAALFLAYNEFGEQKDSGLWMYLGIAIRLAQDLGMHKLEGLKYVGKTGPTPKMVKRQSQRSSDGEFSSRQEMASFQPVNASKGAEAEGSEDVDEQKAVESERVDTFWAIFFLDRVVSSGTGRRSTLRDKDIELSFPSDTRCTGDSQWPAPFPALIRIVHLYGRVADLLNGIKEPSDITPETPGRLADMERKVTDFYESLSSRLHFDAVNFQHYTKAGEGTNFVLLHFWFHTLIILLHHPTLLKTFEGPMLQLFPNSRDLAMSSAKTIADILNYSHLIDSKASLGNPFTSQPIYIAACAFLKETAEQNASSGAHSQATTPGRERDITHDGTPSSNSTPLRSGRKESISVLVSHSTTPPTARRPTPRGIDPKTPMTRYTLATVANQHYQLCYKALQSLEVYWAGTKYILTVLDQKFEGVCDPLLYTTEEGEAAVEEPKPVPAFTSPGWRRQYTWDPSITNSTIENISSPFWKAKSIPESPRRTEPGKPIGWALTGTMDSSSTHLAYHYASANQSSSDADPGLGSVDDEKTIEYDNNPSYPEAPEGRSKDSHQLAPKATMGQLNVSNYSIRNGNGDSAVRPATLSANTAYNPPSCPNDMPSQYQSHLVTAPYGSSNETDVNISAAYSNMYQQYNLPGAYMAHQAAPQMNFLPGDMMIESQDVDMSMLGLEMMPWFDPFPHHDITNYFDPGAHRSDMPDNNNNDGQTE